MDTKPVKLLDRIRNKIRLKHYSIFYFSTELYNFVISLG